MAAPNTNLTSLWVDDVPLLEVTVLSTGSPVKQEVKQDFLKFYKDSGLEPVAKQSGVLDVNGDIDCYRAQAAPNNRVTPMAVKVEPTQILPQNATVAMIGSPMVLHTPQSVTLLQHASPAIAAIATTPVMKQLISVQPSPTWVVQKRPASQLDYDTYYSESKRSKKTEKGGKGLRHFSMKVCEKVQEKRVTTYNEVADELVAEFTDPNNVSFSDQTYDQKNIRRRVYDALNVLMAMNIISKEKKEIKWIGLPTNSAQECQNLQLEKKDRLERIKHKTQQLQELILQQIAFKNLVQRNRQSEQTHGQPMSNSAIQLPFIVVNTSKKTVIDCSISNNKYEYLFNFDNTFEIHDDIEVLKRMGMAFNLERNQCTQADLMKAVRMVPKDLEPYVMELANVNSAIPGTSGLRSSASAASGTPTFKLSTSCIMDQLSADAEVASIVPSATSGGGMSRQSSVVSFSDAPSARGTPSESFDSESDRSSPVDMN